MPGDLFYAVTQKLGNFLCPKTASVEQRLRQVVKSGPVCDDALNRRLKLIVQEFVHGISNLRIQ